MPFDLGFWKQWEGQQVDSKFPLERCLHGDEHGAVYESQAAAQAGKSTPAILRIVLPGDPASGGASLETLHQQWKLAAGLSHPALTPLLAFGETQLGGDSDDAPLRCAFVVQPQPDETLVDVLAERPLTAGETRETIQPVLKALRYLESKGISPREFNAASVQAFGEQVKISTDNLHAADGESARQQAAAKLLRALGLLLEQMLRGKASSSPGAAPLPAPFEEIVRNCAQTDASNAASPWTLSMVEASLRGESPAPRRPAVETRRPPQPPASVTSGTPVPKARSRRPNLLLWGIGVTAALALAVAVMNRPDSASVAGTSPQPSLATPPSPSATPTPATTSENPQRALKPTTPPAASKSGNASRKPSPTSGDPRPAAPQASQPQPPAIVEGVTQVMPEIPQNARNTINGRVRINIRVQVDAAGNVTQARQDAPMGSKYFATRAITAAQSWKFPPGNASRDFVIRFELGRDQTRASAVKLSE